MLAAVAPEQVAEATAAPPPPDRAERERQRRLAQGAKQGSRASVCFGLAEGEGSSSPTLTQEDCEFFAANGFLLKKGLLDNVKCEEACDYVWRRAPKFLRRDDPSTWLDPHLSWTPSKGRTGSSFNGGPSWKMHDCGDAPWMLSLFGANPRVLAHVQGLVGGQVRPPTRTRGVYSVWPNSKHRDLPDDAIGDSLGPHNDGSAQVLNGMAYLDTVQHRGGGFTIWPGAHRLLYYAYGHQFNPGRDPELYNALMAQVKATITPLEICAPRGSVIFWHGRMAHSPGIHRGGPDGDAGPRFAVPTDWQRHHDTLSSGPASQGLQLEWFKDAPVYEGDSLGPPKMDMFEDWGLTPEAALEVAAEVEAEFEE